ncbi:MAG: hypothetical protein Q4B35_03305 [Slackia sp.]|nr:hypothetical protein [Slackia sp.]
MEGMVESFVRAAVFVLVVCPVIAWICVSAKKEKATRSLKAFVVDVPVSMRRVLAIAAVVFEVVMLGVFVAAGVQTGAWQAGYMWMGHALAFVCLALWAMASLQRLQVDGDVLRYRSVFGRTREAAFSDLSRVEVDGQLSLMRLYVRDKRFAVLSLDCRCMKNLRARLEREGVAMQDRVAAPMTKRRLVRAAVFPGIVIGAAISAVMSFVTAVAAIGGGMQGMLLLVPGIWVIVVPACTAAFAALALRGLRAIALQQKALRFSFDDEMAACGARGTSLQNDRWFVGVSNAQIVAFRRDYVRAVGKRTHSSSGDECTVTAFDGTKLTVRAAAPTLDELRAWFAREASDRR